MNPYRPWAASVRAVLRSVAIGVGVVSCDPGPRELPRDASSQTLAAVAECGVLSDVGKQSCYKQRLLAELDRSGTRPALDMLEDIAAADRDVVRAAHVYTHAIGIESYDPERPVSELFSECTELFQSGCYHGLIQAHFMASGDVTETTVQELCEAFKGTGGDQFLLFQCLHGMGHGLAMLYRYYLPQALEGCDLLGSSWDRESCYGGAFMENIGSATNPHHPATELVTEPAGDGVEPTDDEAAATGHDDGMSLTEGLEPFEQLRDDDPHYPCSALDSRYLTACYMMQTSVMLWQTGNDIGKAAELCMDAPEDWRKTCYQSLGRDISAHTLQDPADSLRECRKSPEEYREWCYVGLVKNFVDLTATTDAGFAFCAMIEDEGKPRCYEAMGEEIFVLNRSEADRRTACSASGSPELERSCLYGARVPTN